MGKIISIRISAYWMYPTYQIYISPFYVYRNVSMGTTRVYCTAYLTFIGLIKV